LSLKADILLVAPSSIIRKSVQDILGENGFKLKLFSSLPEAFVTASNCKFDLLIFDGTPKDAEDLLQEIQKQNRGAQALLLTGAEQRPDLEAVRRHHLAGCIFKPLREAELRFEVARLLSSAPAVKTPRPDDQYIHHYSRNPKMAELYDAAVKKIARSDSTVIILGESGTGKELMAKWIYSHSPRKDKPFIKVSCAVLPEGVLESELFGHEKGAFTGAYVKRKGRFELADSGTIFLDEIGDITPAIQSKFLRVLQEREFQRIGSNDTIRVDVRLIAATSRDLWQEVQIGRFREDLYYRLNVISLKIPPLRERREDIPSLAALFCRKFAEKSQKSVQGFDNRTMQLLLSYSWPGNVRELENVVERAVVLTSGNVITADDLPVGITRLGETPSTSDLTLKEAREKFEAEYVRDTIVRFHGNVSRSAEYLGLARKNLIEKLRRYGIKAEEYRQG